MKLRRWVCFLLCLVLTVCLCTPALADGELFFVAVNDTIPLTLSVFPTYSGGTLYVPYQVLDSQPCGVTPSYNQTKQTYVLLSQTRQMIFDLAAGTVSDESGSVSTANVLYRGGILYLPLTFCASHFGLKTTMLESAGGSDCLPRPAEPERLTAPGKAHRPPQQRRAGDAGAARNREKARDCLSCFHRQRNHARQHGSAGNLQSAWNIFLDRSGDPLRPVADF